MKKFFVEIVKFENMEVVKRIDCGTQERKADIVDAGANRNLNHEKYFTRVVSDEENEKDAAPTKG